MPTLENHAELTTPDPLTKETELHRLTQGGRLGLLPSSIREGLPKEAYQAKDNAGVTPLHWAAKTGTLSCVPPEALDVAALLLKDKHGRSPISMAAEHAHMGQIPITESVVTYSSVVEEHVFNGLRACSEALQASVRSGSYEDKRIPAVEWLDKLKKQVELAAVENESEWRPYQGPEI